MTLFSLLVKYPVLSGPVLICKTSFSEHDFVTFERPLDKLLRLQIHYITTKRKDIVEGTFSTSHIVFVII